MIALAPKSGVEFKVDEEIITALVNHKNAYVVYVLRMAVANKFPKPSDETLNYLFNYAIVNKDFSFLSPLKSYGVEYAFTEDLKNYNSMDIFNLKKYTSLMKIINLDIIMFKRLIELEANEFSIDYFLWSQESGFLSSFIQKIPLSSQEYLTLVNNTPGIELIKCENEFLLMFYEHIINNPWDGYTSSLLGRLIELFGISFSHNLLSITKNEELTLAIIRITGPYVDILRESMMSCLINNF